MDDSSCRIACRMLCYTVAVTVALVAPAALQATLVLQPGLLSGDAADLAMSLALAGTVVSVPAMLHGLICGKAAGSRRAR